MGPVWSTTAGALPVTLIASFTSIHDVLPVIAYVCFRRASLRPRLSHRVAMCHD
jgi:hypothetical protein